MPEKNRRNTDVGSTALMIGHHPCVSRVFTGTTRLPGLKSKNNLGDCKVAHLYIIFLKAVFQIHTIIVKNNDAEKRIDKFLLKTLCSMPQSLLYKFLRTKKIKLNGKRAEPGTILKTGDKIDLYISDEFFYSDTDKLNKTDKLSNPSLNLMPHEIVYEDDNIVLIDKPQGELVHSEMPGEEKAANEICIIDRFCGYMYKKGEYNPGEENSFTPALCNRLDRNTCGIVIAAKNSKALAFMNEKIKNRELEKKYLCVVYGVPEKKSALLKHYLYKDKSKNRVFIFESKEQAKKSLNIKYDDDIKTVITKYQVLKKLPNNKSLVEVELITGRTHQIRAHLAYIGHPIVGDGKYGVNHKSESGKKFQMLCSYYLKFVFKDKNTYFSYLDGQEFYSRFTMEDTK